MPSSQQKADFHNQLSLERAVVAAGNRTNGTVNGDDIDIQNDKRVSFVVCPGTITDGTHAVKLQESDTGGGAGYTDVAAADQSGTFAANLTSNVPQAVSYIGSKRFVRMVVTTSGATTGGIFSAVAVSQKGKI